MSPSTPYETLAYQRAPGTMERLAALFHDVYQVEARRQAGLSADTVRHPDEYAALPEHTKDYDRALAIFVLEHLLRSQDVHWIESVLMRLERDSRVR